MQKDEIIKLEKQALEVKKLIMRMISKKGKGHFGGSLSLAEIVTVLYFKTMNIDPNDPKKPDRDMFVLSKGHAGPVLYAALALKGFFPEDWVWTLNQPHTKLPSHVDRTKTPGIDMTAGSLGQGLSVAVGMAEGARLNGSSQRIYCAVGDGESQEGQVWEALMYAGVHKLSNLCLILDRNRVQSDNYVEKVLDIDDIVAKLEAFRFNVIEIDGHDIAQIDAALEKAKAETSRPTAIVAHTVKGHGMKGYEGTPASHAPEVPADVVEAMIEDMEKEALAKWN